MSNVIGIETAAGFKAAPDPIIEYTYTDERGLRRKTVKAWKLPETVAAIEAWMGRYFERVAAGYIPDGMDEAPIPHSARIKVGRRVVARWKLDLQPDGPPPGFTSVITQWDRETFGRMRRSG